MCRGHGVRACEATDEAAAKKRISFAPLPPKMSLLELPLELLEPIILLSLSPGPLAASCRSLRDLIAADSVKAKLFLWLAWDAKRRWKRSISGKDAKDLQLKIGMKDQKGKRPAMEAVVPFPTVDFSGSLGVVALQVAAGMPACTKDALSALDRLVGRTKGKRDPKRLVFKCADRPAIPRWLAGSSRHDAQTLMIHLVLERGFNVGRDSLVAAVKAGNERNLDMLLQNYPAPAPDILLPLSLLAPKTMFEMVLPVFKKRATPLAAGLKLAAERGDAVAVRRLLEVGAIPGDVGALKKVRETLEGRSLNSESKTLGSSPNKKQKAAPMKHEGPRKRRKFAD